MSQFIESELSFLVRYMPDLAGAKFEAIEQAYLNDDPEPLRLRRKGDKYVLTQKIRVKADDFSRKEERELELDRKSYLALQPVFKRSLSKTRYYLPLTDGLVAEIDVFHGELKGLIMVEVEFTDEEVREKFVPPPWFGRDVSQEEWSSNAFPAGKTFEEIEHFVKG